MGLSPFKTEKTPSFTVNDEKGFYHCFSTAEHGNIFDFLIKTQSIGFGEAVKKLAAEAGLQPYRFSKIDEQKEKRSQSYKKICLSYSNFCKENLNSKANFKVQEYLKKRGLSSNTIEDFNLGYSPDRETSFKYLSKKFYINLLIIISNELANLFCVSNASNKSARDFKPSIQY